MSGPTRFQAPMPTVVRPPRVGRLRLGEKTAKGYPKAVDYFRVDEDESGITSAEAAAAFAAKYPGQPKQVRIQIPAHTIEQVLDQAYRVYGKGGLKRQCQGPAGECSVKTQSGSWQDEPCWCASHGLDPDGEPHPDDACEFNFSFSFLLPDVSGIGIWDIASGSTMSRDAIVGFLQMMLNLRGAIALLECDMLVVMKTGRAGALVPTVELRTHEGTPRELLAAAAAAKPLNPGEVPELEPGALDQPEPTIHQAGFAETPPTPTAGAEARASRHGHREPAATGQPAVGDSPDDDDVLSILRDNVEAQLRFLGPPQVDRLRAVCEHYGVRPTRDGLIEAWGGRAEDLPNLLEHLETEINGMEQETLEGTLVPEDDEIPF